MILIQMTAIKHARHVVNALFAFLSTKAIELEVFFTVCLFSLSTQPQAVHSSGHVMTCR